MTEDGLHLARGSRARARAGSLREIDAPEFRPGGRRGGGAANLFARLPSVLSEPIATRARELLHEESRAQALAF